MMTDDEAIAYLARLHRIDETEVRAGLQAINMTPNQAMDILDTLAFASELHAEYPDRT